MKKKYLAFIGLGLLLLALCAYYLEMTELEVELLVFLAGVRFSFVLIKRMMKFSYTLRD